jgi:D-alanine-D-alanine ligase-like ATP-grasp enzyme
MVAKPNDDGCSTGVVILDDDERLRKYAEYLKTGGVVPARTFLNQPEKITVSQRQHFLLEEFIQTDDIVIHDKKLQYKPGTGWIELTVGVVEKNGTYQAFQPSVTVAEAGILSLEEKFQGGTGVNITPPPEEIISAKLAKQIRDFMEKVAQKVGVKDYCRIDIFANNQTNEVIVIEVNTLPGLSPSTVLFQQAAAAGQTPLEFLEAIIKR